MIFGLNRSRLQGCQPVDLLDGLDDNLFIKYLCARPLIATVFCCR